MEGKNNGLVRGILTLILIVAVFSGILYGETRLIFRLLLTLTEKF